MLVYLYKAFLFELEIHSSSISSIVFYVRLRANAPENRVNFNIYHSFRYWKNSRVDYVYWAWAAAHLCRFSSICLGIFQRRGTKNSTAPESNSKAAEQWILTVRAQTKLPHRNTKRTGQTEPKHRKHKQGGPNFK